MYLVTFLVVFKWTIYGFDWNLSVLGEKQIAKLDQ